MAAQDAACPVWVHLDGKQFCSPSLEIAQQDLSIGEPDQRLPFDRVFGDKGDIESSVLYADITHPLFGQFHEAAMSLAREGGSSYRLRYRPPVSSRESLFLNGFGVELVLKRTDYIVIDDRQASAHNDKSEQESMVKEDMIDHAPAVLKPLTTAELEKISLNTASFVMSSQDPLNTLLKVSADFPKHAAMISSHNSTADFLTEYRANRAAFLPQGYNIVWINGVQVDPRSMNAFGLLDHLRWERSLINDLRHLDLSASEAIRLVSHSDVAQAQLDKEPERYDWREDSDGQGIIIWLNDLEKDTRYRTWPTQVRALLQRTYPGQLPTVRRNLHILIVPVDFSDPDDLLMVLEPLQSFVKRAIPVRFGLVPISSSSTSITQAKIAYYLTETYGLRALFAYLDEQARAKSAEASAAASFARAIDGKHVREGRVSLDFEAVVHSNDLQHKSEIAQNYLGRLGLASTKPPVMINGVPLPRTENWLEAMSARVSMDLRKVQRGVLDEAITEESWLPSLFLSTARLHRNPVVAPDDPSSVTILDMSKIAHSHFDVLKELPCVAAAEDFELDDRAHALIVADIDTPYGKSLLSEAMKARKDAPGIEIVVLHNPKIAEASSGLSLQFYKQTTESRLIELEKAIEIISGNESVQPSQAMEQEAAKYWTNTQALRKSLDIGAGFGAVVLNGRLIDRLESGSTFMKEDFLELFAFEKRRRIKHVVSALTDLDLQEKVTNSIKLAQVTSLVARAHISVIPEGIFESPPLVRIDKFKLWNSTHSAIDISTTSDAAVEIVAAVDPTSETAQQWIPTLKTLSELQGINVKIFMNPRERVLELPVKRFFRQALDSAPVFDNEGHLHRPQLTFLGIPGEALLNLGMDVPASWLVTPQQCDYDLDNIKLNSVPKGDNVNAVYRLEHILIEGHSRDVLRDSPPAGVQLSLGTKAEPNFADTIIMANLGYFQFKATPGQWHISLMPGRSSDIFNIDSVGSQGFSAQPGDETTSVALYSFHGTTLYPRLSRKRGKESEELLETEASRRSVQSYLRHGISVASSALSSIGFFGSPKTQNADVNIFSVASGHLYERMLNIMMVSVMKHTKHTVKFWLIKQFLSPSFKASLPHLARHYNFSYELVTFKWPHWLRGQKEKQREIWGYKILFLDVLFPLHLDKVIFVDADQVVRTDMMELNQVDLHGAPYGFTPMCDSRHEMEGFRFWKQGYWANFLNGKPYHISALYVVDLKQFRQMAAGDRLRQQYQALSADPASLSNLDQDLPNHMQHNMPIFSLPQEWLWCETWCDDASLQHAKTIDLCNNPQTKEPKLERARRQLSEWSVYDEEIAHVLGGHGKIGQGDSDSGSDTKADKDPALVKTKEEL